MCRENVNKVIHLFLLALFLSYYESITFFSHYHVVNGVTIVHSHFFRGDPDSNGQANHTHSSKELTLIVQLSHFITLENVALAILIPFFVAPRHYHVKSRIEIPEKQAFTLSLLRAPPLYA